MRWWRALAASLNARDPQSVLQTMTETVARALKLPYVAISLRERAGDRIAVAYGADTGKTVRLPLLYGDEPLGELRVAPRGDDHEPPGAQPQDGAEPRVTHLHQAPGGRPGGGDRPRPRGRAWQKHRYVTAVDLVPHGQSHVQQVER
jgi:GAF domain-containing protein